MTSLEYELKNVYLGYEFEPSSSTIAYFPFKEDASDKAGSRTLTLSNCSVSGGVMNITSQASYMSLSSTIGGSQITGSVRYYYGALSTGGGWNTLFAKNGGTYHHVLIPATTSDGKTIGNIGFYNSGFYPSNKVLELSKWYHILFTKNGTNQKIYVNGVLVLDSNSSFDNNSQPLGMISSYNTGSGNQGAQGKMSEVFFESRVWTAEEVLKYYNATKSLYGITN